MIRRSIALTAVSLAALFGEARPWRQKSKSWQVPASEARARCAVRARDRPQGRHRLRRHRGHQAEVEAGEPFDIAIPSPELIDDLIKQGKVVADTRTVFGRTGLGVAVRKGIPTPDITTVDAFKRALLSAKSVGHSKEGQTGLNFLIVLERLGITAEMKSKLKTYEGNPMAEALEKGTEEMGVTGMEPVLDMKDVQKLGGLPPEIQRYLNFSAGVSANSKEPEAARALLKFMMSPEAAAVARAKGLERE